MTTLLLSRVPSPLGEVLLVRDGAALCALDFADYEDRMHRLLRRQLGPHVLREDASAGPPGDALAAYFAGKLRALDAIVLRQGGTPFQRRVWAVLRAIPPAETRSYGWLAVELGDARLTRAVGAANGQNPVSIVVPCHRVVGADKALTGYGGGLHRKQWLLQHEVRCSNRM